MGALHHHFWSLLELPRVGGRALRGVVEVAHGGTVRLRITQRWPEPPPPVVRPWWAVWRSAPPPLPDTVDVGLTPEIVWTDPHVSPSRLGLIGGRRSGTVGHDVIAVIGMTTELLEPTPHVLDTLAIAFDPAVRAAYPARPREHLAADLGNPDRRDLALQALGDDLRPELVYGALDPGVWRGWLGHRQRVLDNEVWDTFLMRAAAVDGWPEHRRVLLEHLTTSPPTSSIGLDAWGALFGRLDPADRADLSILFHAERWLVDRHREGKLPPIGAWAAAIDHVVRACGADEESRRAMRAIALSCRGGSR